MLSLGLKRRRTRVEIESDRRKAEEEQALAKAAVELKRQLVTLEKKEKQDKATIDELQEANKRLKAEHGARMQGSMDQTKPKTS